MAERFIPLSRFVGESEDILDRLANAPPPDESIPFANIEDLPLTEEYKKTQEAKKQTNENNDQPVGIKSSDK